MAVIIGGTLIFLASCCCVIPLEHVPYLTPVSLPLVIVNNLHIDWPFCCPFEANTVLFIYFDAVLPLPVAAESLQAVSRRDSELSEERDRIQQLKPSSCDCPQLIRTGLPGCRTVKDPITPLKI